MSETLFKFDRDTSFDDLESIVMNMEAIPSVLPRLERIGVSKPQKDRGNNGISVVEVGFRHFRRGQLNYHEYDLYE